MPQDLKIETIADRLIEAILADNILSKDKLKDRIIPILKIWIKGTNLPGRNAKIKDMDKHRRMEFQIREEKQFWRKKLEEQIGKDNMNPYYEEINNHLKELGLYPL